MMISFNPIIKKVKLSSPLIFHQLLFKKTQYLKIKLSNKSQKYFRQKNLLTWAQKRKLRKCLKLYKNR